MLIVTTFGYCSLILTRSFCALFFSQGITVYPTVPSSNPSGTVATASGAAAGSGATVGSASVVSHVVATLVSLSVNCSAVHFSFVSPWLPFF